MRVTVRLQVYGPKITCAALESDECSSDDSPAHHRYERVVVTAGQVQGVGRPKRWWPSGRPSANPRGFPRELSPHKSYPRIRFGVRARLRWHPAPNPPT